MSNFKKTKSQAWLYYRKWMNEKTFCPILNKEIKITRKGWNHIISGSNSRKRNIKDKHMRLNLLKPAKHVIKNAQRTYITNKNGIKYIVLEGKADKGKTRGKIKILLKNDKQGNLFFYSVMKA